MDEHATPTWNPDLFDAGRCDHAALPEKWSHCIVCGWRKWLSDTELEFDFDRPWTSAEKREVLTGAAWPGKFRGAPSRNAA